MFFALNPRALAIPLPSLASLAAHPQPELDDRSPLSPPCFTSCNITSNTTASTTASQATPETKIRFSAKAVGSPTDFRCVDISCGSFPPDSRGGGVEYSLRGFSGAMIHLGSFLRLEIDHAVFISLRARITNQHRPQNPTSKHKSSLVAHIHPSRSPPPLFPH